MRAFLAGIICLLLASATFAGVIGKVDSIGFGSLMRGDCWVPLLVQVTSDAAGPEEYQLQVVQTDPDGDDVVYARPITVNPGTTSYWTYFKPQSFARGLPRAALGSTQDLPRALRIFLATPDGGKRIVQLNVSGASPDMLEEQDSSGEKLIVCAGRPPNVREFNPQPVQNGIALVSGMSEDAMFVSVDTRHMPDNVLGYDAVDAIVWTDSEVSKLDALQFRAIREYVSGGGTLVILQSAEVARTERFADMLPVTLGRIESTEQIEPLRTILHAAMPKPPIVATTGRPLNAWENVTGPHRIARSVPLPDAYVAHWIDWPGDKPTPYIARRVIGSGTVIWVAQDVSDPTIRGIAYGWPNFWAKVFDWPVFDGDRNGSYHYLQVPPVKAGGGGGPDIDRIRRYWTSAGTKELGFSYTAGLDLESKTAALLSVAFLFFIVYWAVAGPGAYLILAARKRTHLSWFVFGMIALLATVFTVGVAQLVLRGGAQIRHVSLVRAPSGTGSPAHVESRFGIYFPQDRSDTEIALSGFSGNGPTVITPFAVHPRFAPSDEPNLRDTRYTVPIRNEDDVEKVITAVPFRSTLKKLEAEWTGDLAGRVTGIVRTAGAAENAILVGSVTNNTGRDLSNILFVYRTESINTPYRVLYQRSWPKGQTLDLARAIAGAEGPDTNNVLWLDRQKGAFGALNYSQRWLYQGYRASMAGQIVGEGVKVDDSAQGYRQSFYVSSLFGILPPMQNEDESVSRVEVMRRGVRDWDVSNTAAAGALVVLATSNSDQIPIPLTVEGEAPEGTGVTFWQFVLPLDRTETNKPPGTQPSTQPAQDVNVEK